MVAKINTPTKKSVTTKKYSEFLTGGGVSPMVVSVSVDQYMLYAYFLTKRPNSGSEGSGYTKASVPKPMALEKE